ncbi:MAG: flagellar hook-associated protein FlgL [Thermodesulfobacteriota bacterium]
MRVSMATVYSYIQRNLQNLSEELSKINLSISSGKKYSSISDNPVEVGALLGLTTSSDQVAQYKRNLNTAQDWLATTESTLSNVGEIVKSCTATAEQMATGTYNASQRIAAAQSIQQLLEEIMQGGNANYNGQYILSGYKIDTQPFVEGAFTIQTPVMKLQTGSTGTATSGGAYVGTTTKTYVVEIVQGGATGVATFHYSEDGGQTWSDPPVATGAAVAVGTDGVTATFGGTWVEGDRFSIPVYKPITYQGDDNTLEIGIGRNSRLEVNKVGSDVLGGTGGSTDIFEILAQLKSALEANDAMEAGASLENLKTYQDQLNATLAGLGAALNRVTVKNEVYDTLQQSLTDNIAEKGDTDLVEAANALAAKELAYQAALASSTQVMSLSLLDYMTS